MRHRHSIPLLLLTAALCFSTSVEAQLLEDTDKKLKTSQKEKRGFLGGLFSKKGKSDEPSFLSFGRTSSGKRIQPRYSRPAFNQRPVQQQRSISFQDPFKGERPRIQPRYSPSGSPFSPKDREVKRWEPSKSPFPSQRYKNEIRSVSGMPFTNDDKKVKPKFSPPSPYPKKYYNVKPSYSGTGNFNLALRKFWKNLPPPRGVKDAGPVMWEKEREKYKNIAKYRGPFPDLKAKKPKPPSTNSELGPIVWEVKKKSKPEDVSSYMGPFSSLTLSKNKYKKSQRHLANYLGPNNGIRYSKSPYKKSDSELAEYLGPHKIKLAKVKGDLHPSHRYKKTVLIKSDFTREGLRKWNIFWAGINLNQEKPKGVKEKISKPKFDKKEREIWNN